MPHNVYGVGINVVPRRGTRHADGLRATWRPPPPRPPRPPRLPRPPAPTLLPDLLDPFDQLFPQDLIARMLHGGEIAADLLVLVPIDLGERGARVLAGIHEAAHAVRVCGDAGLELSP
jgi:hypothetical protein